MFHFRHDYYLRMSAKQVDDLTTASAPWYRFVVRNSNGFFYTTDWQTSTEYEYHIGDENELCALLHPTPSIAEDDIHSLYFWEFAVQVKDDNENISPLSEWKAVDLSVADELECGGINEAIPVYVLLWPCSSGTIPFSGECEGALDITKEKAGALAAQTSRWVLNHPELYDPSQLIYLVESEFVALGKNPPFTLSYNGMCYTLPAVYSSRRTNYPISTGTVVHLNGADDYDPPQVIDPECAAQVYADCWDIYENPSAYVPDLIVDEDLTVDLRPNTLAQYRMDDNADDYVVIDSMWLNNGISARKYTSQMHTDPSVLGDPLYFDGIEDWVNCVPRALGDAIDLPDSEWNPSAYDNPSYYDPEEDEESGTSNPSAMQPDVLDFAEEYPFVNPSDYNPEANPSAEDEELTYDHDTRFTFGGDYSYSLWIKVHPDQSGAPNIISDGVYGGWALQWNSGTLSLINLSDDAVIATVSGLTTDSWYHVAFSFGFDPSAETYSGSLWVDSIEVDSFSDITMASTDTNLVVGVDYRTVVYYQGWMDDVRVMSTTLNTYWVELIYNSGEGTYLRHWEFYEDTGNNWLDTEDAVTDYQAYLDCVEQGLEDCITPNPSFEFNPSAQEVYFFSSCTECWETTTDLAWICELTSMVPVWIRSDCEEEFIYSADNDSDWIQQFLINTSPCTNWGVYACPDPHEYPVTHKYLTFEVHVWGGTLKYSINGMPGSIVYPYSGSLGHVRADLAHYWALEEMYPDQWELSSRYRHEIYTPYIKIYDVTPYDGQEVTWTIRVRVCCEVQCHSTYERDLRAYPATLCFPQILRSPDDAVYVMNTAIRDAVWRDEKGYCWSISESVEAQSNGYHPSVVRGTLLHYVPQQYDSCAECIGTPASSSSSALSSSSSSSMSSSSSSISSSSQSSSSRSSSLSSSSFSSSSMSSSSQSSSRSSYSSTSSHSSHSSHSSASRSNTSDYHHDDHHDDHHYAGAGFVLEPYSESQKQELYNTWAPWMEDMTTTQKEDYLISLVSDGVLSADQAITLATMMGMDMGA